MEGQALRTVANEGVKELCKVVYELTVGDYFIAAGKP